MGRTWVWYNTHLMSAAFDVHCPCCKAQLTVSPEARAVVSHKAATPPKPVAMTADAGEPEPSCQAERLRGARLRVGSSL